MPCNKYLTIEECKEILLFYLSQLESDINKFGSKKFDKAGTA